MFRFIKFYSDRAWKEMYIPTIFVYEDTAWFI
jgi:hypothetical protein